MAHGPDSNNPKESQPEPFLSTVEVARWLRVSTQTVLTLALVRTKVGRQWRYRRSDVQDFIDRDRVDAT